MASLPSIRWHPIGGNVTTSSDHDAGGQGDHPGRRRLRVVLIIFLAVIAIVAAPIVLLSLATSDGSDSIAAAKRATAPMLADLRARAERAGGSLDTVWSSREMSGMQMVEVTLRGPGTEFDGRAAFMVTPDGRTVEPQDELARMLAMDASSGMTHR